MKIGLVACAKLKMDHAVPAKDLYTSDLFKKARTYCEQNYDAWYILSALHGLVHPDSVIAPYDVTLNDMKKQERMTWSHGVLLDLLPALGDGDQVFFHAGRNYREFIETRLESIGYEVFLPLEGLGIGQQLKWYKERV